MQQQQPCTVTHSRISSLSPDVPRVASRYSVRTLRIGSGRGNPKNFRMRFAPVAEPPFLNFSPISSSTSPQLSSLSPSQCNDLLKKKHIVENKSKIGELITELVTRRRRRHYREPMGGSTKSVYGPTCDV